MAKPRTAAQRAASRANLAKARRARHRMYGGSYNARISGGASAARRNKRPRAVKKARRLHGLTTQNSLKMTKQDKLRATAMMYGAGSKQYKRAAKMFGTKSKRR